MDRHRPSISTVFSRRWINIDCRYWSCFQVGESVSTVDWYRPSIPIHIKCDISTGWLKKHWPIHDTCVNVWHVWRSQKVTILNLWPRSHALLSPSKTDLVKFWSQMSQMVTNSNVTGTKRGWRLSQKQQIFWYPAQNKTQTPRAGTGDRDSAGQFWRYYWATLINYHSNLSMCSTFMKILLPPPNIRELLPNQKEANILSVVTLECDHLDPNINLLY